MKKFIETPAASLEQGGNPVEAKNELQAEMVGLEKDRLVVNQHRSQLRQRIDQLVRVFQYPKYAIIALLTTVFSDQAMAEKIVAQTDVDDCQHTELVNNSADSTLEVDEATKLQKGLEALETKIFSNLKQIIPAERSAEAEKNAKLIHQEIEQMDSLSITAAEVKEKLTHPIFSGLNIQAGGLVNYMPGAAAFYDGSQKAINIKGIEVDEPATVGFIAEQYVSDKFPLVLREIDKRGMDGTVVALMEKSQTDLAEFVQTHRTIESLPDQVLNDPKTLNWSVNWLHYITKNYRKLTEASINHEIFHYFFDKYFFTENYQGPGAQDFFKILKTFANEPQGSDRKKMIDEIVAGYDLEKNHNISFKAALANFEQIQLNPEPIIKDGFKNKLPSIELVQKFKKIRINMDRENNYGPDQPDLSLLSEDERAAWDAEVILQLGNLLNEYLARAYNVDRQVDSLTIGRIDTLRPEEEQMLASIKIGEYKLSDIPAIRFDLIQKKEE